MPWAFITTSRCQVFIQGEALDRICKHLRALHRLEHPLPWYDNIKTKIPFTPGRIGLGQDWQNRSITILAEWKGWLRPLVIFRSFCDNVWFSRPWRPLLNPSFTLFPSDIYYPVLIWERTLWTQTAVDGARHALLNGSFTCHTTTERMGEPVTEKNFRDSKFVPGKIGQWSGENRLSVVLGHVSQMSSISLD
jgi:hypothetical protein